MDAKSIRNEYPLLKLALWRNYLILKHNWPIYVLQVFIIVFAFGILAIGQTTIPVELRNTIITEQKFNPVFSVQYMKSFIPVDNMKLWYAAEEEYIDEIDEIMSKVEEGLKIHENDVENFANKEDLMLRFKNYALETPVYAVIFNIDNTKKKLSYDISIHKNYLNWNNDNFYEQPSGYIKYMHEGFIGIQYEVNKAFIEQCKRNNVNFNFTMQKLPQKPHKYYNYINYTILIVVTTFLTLLHYTSMNPILCNKDKDTEKKIWKYMQHNGMKYWLMPLGWIIWVFFFVVVWSLMITAMIVYTLNCSFSMIFIFLSLNFLTFIRILNYVEHLAMKIVFCYSLLMEIIFIYVHIVTSSREPTGMSLIIIHKLAQESLIISICLLIFMIMYSLVLPICSKFYKKRVRNLIRNISCKRSRLVRDTSNPVAFQDLLSDKNALITIKEVSKYYGNTIAIDSLNMSILENEITVLVGDNGAGKSTLISMITGMTEPSKGTIIFNKNTNKSYCPQEDIFIPEASIEENLLFISMIRGKCRNEAFQEANLIMNKFQLDIYKNSLVSSLSDGMRRKLSLGMALVGDPKILILDEPTARLDQETRHQFAKLLFEMRTEGRTILITTHFKEEADNLADKIYLMQNGKLVDFGTPGFLKNKYARGCTFTLTLDYSSPSNEEIKTICDNLSPLSLEQEVGRKLLFRYDGVKDSKELAEVFTKLDNRRKDWNVSRIGFTDTNLEDVFFLSGLNNKTLLSNQNRSNRDQMQEITISLQNNQIKLQSEKFSPIKSLLLRRWYFSNAKLSRYLTMTTFSLWLIMCGLFSINRNDINYCYRDSITDINWLDPNSTVYYSGENEDLKTKYWKSISDRNGTALNVDNIYNASIDHQVKYNRNLLTEVDLTLGAQFDGSIKFDNISINTFFSNDHSIQTSAPTSLNLAMDAIARYFLDENYAIRARNVPFNNNYTQTLPASIIPELFWFQFTLLLAFGMYVLFCCLILFQNVEVSCKLLKIQNKSRIGTFVYWIVNTLIDAGIGTLAIVLVLLVIWVSDLTKNWTMFGIAELKYIFAVLVCYFTANLPFCYILSYSNKDFNITSIWLLLYAMFGGILMPLVTNIMEYSDSGALQIIGFVIRWIMFVMCPQYGFGYLLTNFSKIFAENYNWKYMNPNWKNFVCRENVNNPCCNSETVECAIHQSYFMKKDFGAVYYIFILIIPYILGILFLCYLTNISSKYKKSSTITDEESIPLDRFSDETSVPVLRVHNLNRKKLHEEFTCDTYLRMEQKRCYGLLGSNGSGKSKIIDAISKDEVCPDNDIDIEKAGGKIINLYDFDYLRFVGFCSKYINLKVPLTGIQLLILIGLARGYCLNDAQIVARQILILFGLDKFAHKYVSTYSGGSKRKLYNSIAFMGIPPFILLDHFTNGLDLKSLKNLWDALSGIKKHLSTSILFTSIDAEECETLCDYVYHIENSHINKGGEISEIYEQDKRGIIVKFGLKSISGSESRTFRREIQEKITNSMSAAEVKLVPDNPNQCSLEFYIKSKSDEEVKMAHAFLLVETLKTSYNKFIDNYEIREPNLEDILTLIY